MTKLDEVAGGRGRGGGSGGGGGDLTRCEVTGEREIERYKVKVTG